MSLSNIITGVRMQPPRVVLYGPHGIGKTTFGASAYKPIFLPFEDGEGKLAAARFPRVTTYTMFGDAITALLREKHDFSTVIADTLDWMEPIIWAETCRRHGWASIETPSYGKGYLAANEVWNEALSGFDALRAKGMSTILLAHSEIKLFQDPAIDHYDRYQLKLQKRAAELVQEWGDAVLFATYMVDIKKTDTGFGRKTVRGEGSGERMIWTEERPSHYAKNRYNLPPQIPMSYPALVEKIIA